MIHICPKTNCISVKIQNTATTRVLPRTKDTKNWPKAAKSLQILEQHPHALNNTPKSWYGLVLFTTPIPTLSHQVLGIVLQTEGCSRHDTRERCKTAEFVLGRPRAMFIASAQ